MGKANRNRQASLEDRQLAREQKRQAQEAARKKAKRNKLIAIVATVLAVALLGSLLVYNKMVSSGYFMRQNTTAYTDNFELDQTHASYFFNQIYGQYSSYASYLGIDTSTSLKSQNCSMLESGTWFDYFMTSAKSQMTTMLLFAEEARARGIELDDEDYDAIDESLASLKAAAKSAGVSTSYYIHAVYGAGVSMQDLRDVLEISALYSKCYNAIVDSYSFSEADYKAYLAEHENEMKTIDYLTMSLATSDGGSDDSVTVEAIADYAARFAAAKSRDDFETIAYDYLRNCAYKDDESIDDEYIQEEIDSFFKENASFVEDSDFFSWAYASGRKANDTYTYANEDGTAQYVYMLLTPATLDESSTVNVRHILLSADEYGSDEAALAKAEELLAQWKNGAATAESFAALAAEYSEDTSAEDGGLIENIAPGQTVDEFDAWLFDADRKVGDADIVHSDYGYHIMYLDGYGLMVWESTADSALKSEQYEKDYTEMSEKYSVTFNEANLYAING